MSTSISVFLADDHPIVLDGLARYLGAQSDFAVVGTATSFSSLLEAIPKCRPDVVLLDLGMPGMSGVDGVRSISSLPTPPRVVVFSMQPEDQYALDLLHAGASAFLHKGRSPKEVAEAIRRAAGGARYLTDVLAERLLQSEGSPTRPAHEALSTREREVFLRLAQGHAAKRIAADLNIAGSSVHTYTERIKRKLGVESVPELVRYACRHHLLR